MILSGGDQVRYGYTHPGALNRVVGMPWKSGNKLYVRLQNNNVAAMNLTYSNLVWSAKDNPNQYVDYQSFAPTGSLSPSPYYTGDDYTSPTGVTVSPAIQFQGGGNQSDWITTFGNVSTLTKTYSGSLSFGTGCNVNLSWSTMAGEAPDGPHASAQATPGSGAKGLSRPVQEARPAPAWLPHIQGVLEQAGARVTAWLFRQGEDGPRTARRDRQVLANPPSGNVWRSYYYAAGGRVAVRVQYPTDNRLYFLMGDHLGSTSVSYDVNAQSATIERYLPWGGLRDGANSLPTGYTYTGKYYT